MIYGIVLLTWIVLLAWLAVDIHKRSPWTLFFGAIGFTLYGAIPAIGLSMDGDSLNNIAMKYFGQMLMIFVSVLGGGLMSLALTELRQKAKNNKNEETNNLP
ncbi:hypothetical protein ACH5BF_07795 [Arcobacter sp. YIC-464]|uniref:hypothetical protein n=1 Tax=Arcobacter sp. YIC-464 TaxID=3376631 RepID=UPI003C242B6A